MPRPKINLIKTFEYNGKTINMTISAGEINCINNNIKIPIEVKLKSIGK